MARFENSPNLFGVGGCSTDCEVTCEWCGTTYAKGIDADSAPSERGASVYYTTFGDKQVCECCFEKIENSIISWLPSIIPWFIRMVKAKAEQVAYLQEIINNLKKTIDSQERDT